VRKINNQHFFDIFRENFNFESADIEGRACLKMCAYEAFVFSTISGAQYLDSVVFPFTSRGLMKVFHSHKNLRMVTGLWSGLLPFYSPRNLNLERPFLGSGVKYIFPVSFDSETEYQLAISKLYKLQSYPGEYLVYRIESSKVGSGQESLLEYLACEYFRNMGFLVDSQIPMPQQFGSPDWMALDIRNDNFFEYNSHGGYLFERAMRNFEKCDLVHTKMNKSLRPSGNSIVGEAKVVSSTARKQISKYLTSGLFDQAILSTVDFQEEAAQSLSQIYLDSAWRLEIDLVKGVDSWKQTELFREFVDFVDLLLRFYYLSQLSNQQIIECIRLDLFDSNVEQRELIETVKSVPIDKLMEY
jgi:hypothetical protein